MNKNIEYKIGINIKNLRENKNITQELLAAKLQLNGCDITRSAVAKIEVGQRHLYPDEIILIKKILNVSYDDIFNL
ncbi:MAG: helix-turn-helix domain-containing protein [Ruminococcus sp.]|jgi:transcriptional regulator with XRE-family HTH domain|nr:helix-turn-helix domain-containing protein [Ruminococcus sp.]